MVSGWWSLCRDFGDGCSGGGFVDDGFVGRERGDEGLDGEVVHGAGDAASDLVGQRDGVVGEHRVGTAGQRGIFQVK